MRYVRLRVRTNWSGKKLRPGDELYVPEEVAVRWERNRIAHVLDTEPQPDSQINEPAPSEGKGASAPVLDDGAGYASSPEYTFEQVGTSSWHNILRGGEVVERVNGANATATRLRELNGEE